MNPRASMEVQAALGEADAVVSRHHHPGSSYMMRERVEAPMLWQHIPGWIWEDVMAPHPLGDQHHTADLQVFDARAGHGLLSTFVRQLAPWATITALDAGGLMPRSLLHEQSINGIAADIQTLQIARPGFDIILMAEVLQHLPRSLEVLRNMRSALLRPHGRLYLSAPCTETPPQLLPHASWRTEELRDLVTAAGFEVQRWEKAPGAGMGRHHNLTLSAV
jgi:2-polyprenyl-3-methyl-5-hydroxy-6-metoxy-1,4-benzoquinol methylase